MIKTFSQNNKKNCNDKIWKLIKKERKRQSRNINLIASENYVSKNVMKAQGSCLTNKYAEGYPGKRYYGGCKYVDKIEKLAIYRAKKLFHADYANVQPHSGSQANFAVYNALLKPNDKILGMKLSDGGHLTHGSIVNFSSKIYKCYSYGVNRFGKIDYEKMYEIAQLKKPKLIIGGFSAYSRRCDWKKMREIADSIKAFLVVDIAHVAGLIIAGLYPNPINYAHVVTSTTHKTLGGPRGGLILSRLGDEKIYKKIDCSVFPGLQGGPLMHVIAAKAIAFKEALTVDFQLYQKNIFNNAKEMTKIFLKKNYQLVSNGTSNHLFLLDLSKKKITGKEAEKVLGKCNIIVNKNTIPNDYQSPFITSGIRIGTPAITRRGFNRKEIKQVALWICKILKNKNNKEKLRKIKHKVIKLCNKYPI